MQLALFKMIGPIRWPGSNRRTCSIHVLLLLVLLLSVVLAGGSRVRSKKHRTSRGTSHAARWQSRASTDGTSNAIHELAAKPAPFSKAAHSGGNPSGGPKKRSYYVPAVTNLENFINNIKTGIGASKLAHAVNGVTGAIQQAVSMPGHGPINLLGSHRPVAGIHNAAGYYSNANELRYGQPFTKQGPSHFKSASVGYGGKKAGTIAGGKRGRHSSTASPPGKYDSLMSDLGISGYKHFENAVIRDLERREELKVEATIHTLFPDAADDDWRPIASIKKAPLPVRATAPELSESKIVTALAPVRAEKQRPLDAAPTRTAKPKLPGTGTSSAGRYGLTSTSAPSPKATSAPTQKHRSKAASLGKEKRPKERVKCWNCATATSTTVAVRPVSITHPTPARLPATTGGQSQRFGPAYDATMFYGNNGKAPAAVAQSYSNVEMQYNRTHAPPFAVAGPWTQVTAGSTAELSTQSAPPVTTFAALAETVPHSAGGLNGLTSPYAGVKKSYAKGPKPYAPATSYLGHSDATTVASTTTHKPTGGSQGTKGTTKKRTTGHHRAVDKHGDSAVAGSSKSELRVKKKFDPKYSRNRGTIKFKDALEKNPDQIYR
ncbi:uncharacterized protein LOC133391980 [Anopheles gambiae]|uniref:uncharacterized protein LOC133391980 n=1 Tax=Anopheles gambiae TaxID=7165 RepID=UPI002AC97581|nr:uncharacterized protein LOC133391980 [Anopheles gambiae]